MGLMEEHGWRIGHEKRPNENYGRDSGPRNVDEKYRFLKKKKVIAPPRDQSGSAKCRKSLCYFCPHCWVSLKHGH